MRLRGKIFCTPANNGGLSVRGISADCAPLEFRRAEWHLEAFGRMNYFYLSIEFIDLAGLVWGGQGTFASDQGRWSKTSHTRIELHTRILPCSHSRYSPVFFCIH